MLWIKKKNYRVPYTKIIDIIESEYRLLEGGIVSQRRTKTYAEARHIAYYCMYEYSNLSYAEIADLLFRSDHTTVIHGIKKIKRMMKEDSSFKKFIKGIESQIA